MKNALFDCINYITLIIDIIVMVDLSMLIFDNDNHLISNSHSI